VEIVPLPRGVGAAGADMADGWRPRLALSLALAAWAGAARAEAPAAPDDRTLVALAVALGACDGAALRGPSRDVPTPEVELVARVRARALGFAEVPEPGAVVPPGLARRIACTRERVNLPARPEPGVVYEAVEVRLTIRGSPEDVAAVLAAAREAAGRVVLVREPKAPVSRSR
jgi:hypothetical protein